MPLRPPCPLQRGSPAVFDIKWIRENPEAFDAGLKRRGIAPGSDIKFSATCWCSMKPAARS